MTVASAHASMTPYHFLISLLVLSLTTSCGDADSRAAPGSNTQVALHLQLPEPLTRLGRFERFKQRLITLELRVSTKDGYQNRLTLSPDNWDGVFVPGLEFPRTADDVLTLEFLAWDRQRDGSPRSFAVLSGKRKVSAEDIGSGRGPVSVTLRLGLSVSASEY
jgi:hypothetical protein